MPGPLHHNIVPPLTYSSPSLPTNMAMTKQEPLPLPSLTALMAPLPSATPVVSRYFRADSKNKIVTHKPATLEITCMSSNGNYTTYSMLCKVSESKIKRRQNACASITQVWLDCTPQKGLHLSRDTVRTGHASLLSIRPDGDGFLVHVETKGGKTEGRQKQRYILLKRNAVYSLTAPAASSIINVELKSKRGELLPIPNWSPNEAEPVDGPDSDHSPSASSVSSTERKTVKAVRPSHARSRAASTAAPSSGSSSASTSPVAAPLATPPSMATTGVVLPPSYHHHQSSRPLPPQSVPPPPLLEQALSGEQPFLYEVDGSFGVEEFGMMNPMMERKTPAIHHQHHHHHAHAGHMVRALPTQRPSSPFGNNGAASDSDPTSEGENNDQSPTGHSPPSPPSELESFTNGWRDNDDLFSLSTSQSTLGAYDGLLEPVTFGRTPSQTAAAAVAAGGPWADFVLPSTDPNHWSLNTNHKMVSLPTNPSMTNTGTTNPLSASAMALQADDFVLHASTPPTFDRTPSPPSPRVSPLMPPPVAAPSASVTAMAAALPLAGELEASSPRSTISTSSSHIHHLVPHMSSGMGMSRASSTASLAQQAQGAKRKSAPPPPTTKRVRRTPAFSLAPRSWDVNAKRAPFRAIITCQDKIEGKVSISFAGHVLDDSSVDVVGAKSIIVDVPPPPPVSVAGTCVEVDVELCIDRVKRWQGTFVYKFGIPGVDASPAEDEEDEDDREPDDDGRGDEDAERRGGNGSRSGKRHKPSGPVRLYAAFESMSAFKGFFSCPQLQKGFQALLQKYISGELGGHRTDSVEAARKMFMTAVAKSEFEPFVRQVMVDCTRFCIHTSRVTTVDAHGFTMLHYVAALGYSDLSLQLTQHGADVNLSGVECACTPVSLVQEWEELQYERAMNAKNNTVLRHDDNTSGLLRHDDKLNNDNHQGYSHDRNHLMNDNKLLNAPPPDTPLSPYRTTSNNDVASSPTIKVLMMDGGATDGDHAASVKREHDQNTMQALQYAHEDNEAAGCAMMASSQCSGVACVADHDRYADHKLMHDRPPQSIKSSSMPMSVAPSGALLSSTPVQQCDGTTGTGKSTITNDGVINNGSATHVDVIATHGSVHMSTVLRHDATNNTSGEARTNDTITNSMQQSTTVEPMSVIVNGEPSSIVTPLPLQNAIIQAGAKEAASAPAAAASNAVKNNDDVSIRRYDDTGPKNVDETEDDDLVEVPLVLKKSWTDPYPHTSHSSNKLMYGYGAAHERASMNIDKDKLMYGYGPGYSMNNDGGQSTTTAINRMLMNDRKKSSSSTCRERSHMPMKAPLSNDLMKKYFGASATHPLGGAASTSTPTTSTSSVSTSSSSSVVAPSTPPLVRVKSSREVPLQLSPKSMALAMANGDWLKPMVLADDGDGSSSSLHGTTDWLTPLATADMKALKHAATAPSGGLPSVFDGMADFFGLPHPKKVMKAAATTSNTTTSSGVAPMNATVGTPSVPTTTSSMPPSSPRGTKLLQRAALSRTKSGDGDKVWPKALPVMAMVAAAAAAAVVAPTALQAWSNTATPAITPTRGSSTALVPTTSSHNNHRRGSISSSSGGRGHDSSGHHSDDRDRHGVGGHSSHTGNNGVGHQAHCLAMIESLTEQVDRDRAAKDAARQKQKVAMMKQHNSPSSSASSVSSSSSSISSRHTSPSLSSLSHVFGNEEAIAAKVLKSSYGDAIPALVTQDMSITDDIDTTLDDMLSDTSCDSTALLDDVYGMSSSSLFSFTSSATSKTSAATMMNNRQSPAFTPAVTTSSLWSNKPNVVTAKAITMASSAPKEALAAIVVPTTMALAALPVTNQHHHSRDVRLSKVSQQQQPYMPSVSKYQTDMYQQQHQSSSSTPPLSSQQQQLVAAAMAAVAAATGTKSQSLVTQQQQLLSQPYQQQTKDRLLSSQQLLPASDGAVIHGQSDIPIPISQIHQSSQQSQHQFQKQHPSSSLLSSSSQQQVSTMDGSTALGGITTTDGTKKDVHWTGLARSSQSSSRLLPQPSTTTKQPSFQSSLHQSNQHQHQIRSSQALHQSSLLSDQQDQLQTGPHWTGLPVRPAHRQDIRSKKYLQQSQQPQSSVVQSSSVSLSPSSSMAMGVSKDRSSMARAQRYVSRPQPVQTSKLQFVPYSQRPLPTVGGQSSMAHSSSQSQSSSSLSSGMAGGQHDGGMAIDNQSMQPLVTTDGESTVPMVSDVGIAVVDPYQYSSSQPIRSSQSSQHQPHSIIPQNTTKKIQTSSRPALSQSPSPSPSLFARQRLAKNIIPSHPYISQSTLSHHNISSQSPSSVCQSVAIHGNTIGANGHSGNHGHHNGNALQHETYRSLVEYQSTIIRPSVSQSSPASSLSVLQSSSPRSKSHHQAKHRTSSSTSVSTSTSGVDVLAAVAAAAASMNVSSSPSSSASLPLPPQNQHKNKKNVSGKSSSHNSGGNKPHPHQHHNRMVVQNQPISSMSSKAPSSSLSLSSSHMMKKSSVEPLPYPVEEFLQRGMERLSISSGHSHDDGRVAHNHIVGATPTVHGHSHNHGPLASGKANGHGHAKNPVHAIVSDNNNEMKVGSDHVNHNSACGANGDSSLSSSSSSDTMRSMKNDIGINHNGDQNVEHHANNAADKLVSSAAAIAVAAPAAASAPTAVPLPINYHHMSPHDDNRDPKGSDRDMTTTQVKEEDDYADDDGSDGDDSDNDDDEYDDMPALVSPISTLVIC